MGVPGSGKTTIYREMAGNKNFIHHKQALWRTLYLNQSDQLWAYIIPLTPKSVGEKKADAIFKRTINYSQNLARFASKNKYLLSLVFDILDSDFKNETLIFWMFNFFAEYEFIIDTILKDELLLIDEGFSQRAISLFAYNDYINWDHVNKYVNTIPLPTQLIVVRSSNQLIEKRIIDREKGLPARMRNLSQENIKRVLINWEKIIDFVIPIFKKKHVKIIIVDNSGDVNYAIKQINEAHRTV